MATKSNTPEGPFMIPPGGSSNTFLTSSISETPGSLRPTLKCGPFIRYHGTDYAVNPACPLWRGSVLVVTEPGVSPSLSLWAEHMVDQQNGSTPGRAAGLKLLEEHGRCFWRFGIEIGLGMEEHRIEYTVSFGTAGELKRFFWVPGRDEGMRIMFHSCNGFSVGTDFSDFSGPALWNDVLRVHSGHPFHVAIGGGDQIYNDGVRVTGPLKPWATIGNPFKRRLYKWTPKLDSDVDEWYYNNYVGWYNTIPFSHANSQIPGVNVWDDHDIIDGYGSYVDHFMDCPVFKGIGRIARKYYMLFQHHTPPQGEMQEDICWIIGKTPGRYIGETSRSVYARLGRRVAFLGVDTRSERTRHMINMPSTYDLLFDRMRRELDTAEGEIKHMIILLAIPIAYPRFAWLENILQSPILGFVRFLNKRFGVAGAMFNKYDGEVDIQDDLDDHYCARLHKHERDLFLLRLQKLSFEKQVRITILSGDVHLAAIGRFYSKTSLGVPVEKDHRYMVNIISSPITNKPPSEAVSSLVAGRNKVHHLDASTDEQLFDFFDKDVHGKSRKRNKSTMPARNYSVITESPINQPSDASNSVTQNPVFSERTKRGSTNAIRGSGDSARAAHLTVGAEGVVDTVSRALNVVIRVEVNKHDLEGKTFNYGFTVPTLEK